MTRYEVRAVFSLAAIFSMRMLGLFMILPIFSLYQDKLAGANLTLIGIALGIYGLTQALLQIPLGMLSDRYGRKRIITCGLSLFVLGSLVAALSSHIYGVILGRALQGAGAVGSSIIALTADLTRIEKRTQSMAIIGMTIGISFALAMVLGPILNTWIHLSGIFWLTGLMGLIAIGLLHTVVPTPERSVFHGESEPIPSRLLSILKQPELIQLDFGILVQHAIMTAVFTALPIVLTQAGLNTDHQGYIFYLPILLGAFLMMPPLVILAEKKHQMKPIFLLGITVLATSLGIMSLSPGHLYIIAITLWLFFTGFTLLESLLPSLISKIAPVGAKGTALGIYSTSQFLGIFIGGSTGGWLLNHFSSVTVFLFCTLLAILWLAIAMTMKKPLSLTTKLLSVGLISDTQARHLTQTLKALPGVFEAEIRIDEGVAHMKVNRTALDERELELTMRKTLCPEA